MNRMDKRQYEALRHARDFCIDNRSDFEAAPTGAQLIADLDTHVKDLDRLFTDQRSGHGFVAGATTTRAGHRDAMQGSVDAIVKAAKVAALQSPGIDRRFRYAPARSDRDRISWGRAFLAADEATHAAITRVGLSAKVLADLPGQIDALDASIANQTKGRDQHVAARHAITSVRAGAVKTLAGLDAIARSVYNGNAEKLAAWTHARRRGPAEDAVTTAPPPAASGDNKVA
jgi:hypothetical protein